MGKFWHVEEFSSCGKFLNESERDILVQTSEDYFKCIFIPTGGGG